MIPTVPTAPAPMAERRLLAAVVRKALLDLEAGDPRHAASAVAYIDSPRLDADCDWLDLDPGAVRAHKEKLMTKRALTHDQVLALHARYTAERISLETLAREACIAPATLSRAFAQAGLPVRKRGSALYSRRYPTDIRRVSKVLSDIAAIPGVVSIRVTFELSIDPEDRS